MVIFHSYVTVYQRVTWDNHLAVMAEKSHLLYGFTALPSAWPEKKYIPIDGNRNRGNCMGYPRFTEVWVKSATVTVPF